MHAIIEASGAPIQRTEQTYNEKMLDFAAARSTEIGKILERCGGLYEPEVHALLIRLLADQPRAYYIDVGSNIGYFPLCILEYLAQHALPTVEIRAHEPLIELRMVSIALQDANNLHYSISPIAISNRVGDAELYVSAVSDASNSLNPNFRRTKGTRPVEVSTLDRLYFEELARVTPSRVVIKVDVESHEVEALEGATAILTQIRPHVICEVLYNRTEKGLNRILREFDYTPHRFDGRDWIPADFVEGDPSYTFRDWLFVPNETTHTLS